MEDDGDLWQAFNGDAAAAHKKEEEIHTNNNDDDDEEEEDIIIITMESDNATTTSSLDDTNSESNSVPTGPSEECRPEEEDVTSTTIAANSNVDVGPPVNIYALAHRHAQIAAADESSAVRNTSGGDDHQDDGGDSAADDNVREGPHASLHLSSELKQNQKKLSDDNDNKIPDSSDDESGSDGTDSTAETFSASDQEADVEVSTDDAPNHNDAVKQSNQSIDNDDSTAPTSESSTSESADTNDTAKKEEEEDPTTTTTTEQHNRTRTVSEDEEDDEEGPKKIILVDYASKLAGAQVLEKSPSFKGASNLLTGDSDKYAIAPCEDKKYVVVGLSEDILVKQIKLSNFERYSSHVREFQVLASQEYPAPSAEYWTLIGTFEANSKNGEQTFDLEEPAWARYLKFKLKTHFGSEHYCTLSQIKVHGSTMLQGFHEQWIESEKELEQEKMMEHENHQQQQLDGEENQQGEIDDDDDDDQENGVVDDTVVEESSSGVEKKEEDVSQQNQLESSAASDDKGDDKTEESVAGDAPPDEEISEGENPPISDEAIESDHSSTGDVDEEPMGKDDGALISSNDDASIPREETVPDQQVFAEEPSETTGDDDKLVEDEEHDKSLDQDPAKNAGKPDQLSDSDTTVEVDQDDSDVSRDKAVTVVEEESADATPNAPDIVKTDEEEIASDTIAAANGSNVKDVVESSPAISEGHIQNDKNPNETPETTNKTNDLSASKTIDKKTDDAKAVSSHSGVANIQEPAKSDTSSNIKDPPAKSVEKDVAATTLSPPAEKNDVKVAAKTSVEAKTSAELIAKISKRFPHASCIKDLDFHAFKSRTLLSNTGQMGQVPGPKGSGQVPGPKMEPIFAKITNEIKSVQMTQHQYEQYISAVKTCYEKLFLDMVNDLDAMERSYDRRLSNLEEVLSKIAPGALSKPRDYRLVAIIPSLATLSNWECAQLMLSVSFTILMVYLRLRRKKTNLKKLSKSGTKSTEGMKPFVRPSKEAATPPATPSSSATDMSPSSINNFEHHEGTNVTTKQNEEQSSRNGPTSAELPSLHELSESAAIDQPSLVRIISSEETEDKNPTAVAAQNNEQILRDRELPGITFNEEKSNNYSPPPAQNGEQNAMDFRVTC